MKLAELLQERKALREEIESLSQTMQSLAQVQEGETPEETPDQLVPKAQAMTARYDDLTRALYDTNATTHLEFENQTIRLTHALSLLDRLKREKSLIDGVLTTVGYRPSRYSRSEIRSVTTFSEKSWRAASNEQAKRIRLLDLAIQQVNWTTDV